jgi:hypothetical protein
MTTLLQNTNAMEYWKESNGQRAYIYSTEWVHPDYGYLSVKSIDMLIDPEILRELGGKYILSNTTISNAEELGFEYLGTWYGDNKVYNIRVYKVLFFIRQIIRFWFMRFFRLSSTPDRFIPD